jgi:ubiquinol-cytochrome c reductase cytochrome b subunit
MPSFLRRRAVRFARWNEQRVGAATGIRWMLRYVFPDHWSFLLGEIALYSFIVLVITGVYLAFFYIPSTTDVVYHGTYAPLLGEHMSEAYRSVVNISLNVPAGLLIRQTHHWAADVFIASILVHFARVLFTSAYRKPRDLNFFIGLTMLMLGILEGFMGYSLVDDLLSGMGLVIAYAVALSIPGIGAQLAFLVWGGPYPGSGRFLNRLELLHILVVPVLIGILITFHIAMIMRQHHSQFPGRGRRERNVVGTPMWPAYALRSVGLLLATAGVLFLLGGLVQINPIWQWGPYHVWLSENGAQPDWYIGWLIGALRLMPNFEPSIGNVTLIPNPFWGGAFFPVLCFGVFFAWPWLDRKFTKDHRRHDLLVRPRDRPTHTALAAAFLSWIFAIYAAGADDRIFYRLHIDYVSQIHFWEAAIWVVPVIVFLLTRSVCRSLRSSSAHPLRAWQGEIIRRRADGSIETLALSEDRVEEPPSQPPVGTTPGKPTRE